VDDSVEDDVDDSVEDGGRREHARSHTTAGLELHRRHRTGEEGSGKEK
jgi:hypothetical protein